jgi:hypothetical protein
MQTGIKTVSFRYIYINFRRLIYVTACSCLFFYLSGCSHEPADYKVRDAINAYFKARDMQVIKLDIKNIEREPLGARKYMGPERHIVQISLITLKPMGPGGEEEDYYDVTVILRKNTDSLYGFSIDNVSGVP